MQPQQHPDLRHGGPRHAPYAWEDTSTRFTSAQTTTSGTGKRHTADETSKTISSTQAVSSYARTGNVLPVAATTEPDIATNVQDAAGLSTEHRTVIKYRKNKALTPYYHETWKTLLHQHNLIEKYPMLLKILQYGFDAGIPNILTMYTPDNSPSLFTNTQQYQEIIDREFDSSRYLRPFSKEEVEDLLGPFQSSPLSLVPKSGKPNKFRAVHNFSFPRTPKNNIQSINQSIDTSSFPCTWGTFNTICSIIQNLPPGSQASIRDVAEAYRTIPITPSQWPGLVVKLREPDRFTINTNNNFGLTSAGGIHGSVADAGTDIFRASKIGPISKWVDDHIFFRILHKHLPAYNREREKWHSTITKNGGRLQEGSHFWYRGETIPDDSFMELDEDASFPFQDLSKASRRSEEDALFAYNGDDIDSISHTLEIPWEKSKTIPFSYSVTYLGFTWNLEEKTVEIPFTKKQKYLLAIVEWTERNTHTLEEVQKLYGKLLHASLIVTAGRAYLTNLETMIPTFTKKPFVARHAPKDTPHDLKWWTAALSSPTLTRNVPEPYDLIESRAYSDASSGFGIAIVIGDRWRAWKLLPGWKSEGRDIGWAESIGFELLVKAVTAECSPRDRFKVYGDNKGVVEGWWNRRSRNKPTKESF